MERSLTENQELELLSALDSRAESPLKFAYVGSGHTKWIDIAKKSRKKHTVQFEENLLKIESLPFIFREMDKHTKTVNIIDFGCGDGIPILPILKYVQHIPTVRYIPIDISNNMIIKAERTVQKKNRNVEVTPILFDFERGEILEDILRYTKTQHTKNYFFLLGNTLGNFNNTEKILSNLKLSMFPDDRLIIGNQVSNVLASSKLVGYYHTREVYNLTASTLKTYGMNCGFEEYNTRWNGEERQIEMFLSLQKKRGIVIAGHTVTFEEGEEILLAISKKFAEESLAEVFNKAGFRIDSFTTNNKKNTCVISIAPSRYKS